jgi:hypothetical protein
MGAALIVATILVAQWQIAEHYGSWNPFEQGTSGDVYK